MKTLIFDGHNALWRLQMRMPLLETSDGRPIQVVYGFLRLVRSCMTQFSPDRVLVCWDSGRSKYRKKLYPEYKANRTDKPKRMLIQADQQLLAIKSLLKYLNIAQVTFPDTEADDLIAIACNELDGDKTIVSSDQDMFQLVSEDVSVWSPIKNEEFTQKNFVKLLELTPKQWLEMRALTGDNSDNISGAAKNFGQVTAKELLLKYKSIDNIYDPKNKSEIKKLGARQALLFEGMARANVYRNLLLMDLSVSLQQPDFKDIVQVLRKGLKKRRKVDQVFLVKYFKEQEFFSLLKDMATWIVPFKDLEVEE